jgi:hypothetical protein
VLRSSLNEFINLESKEKVYIIYSNSFNLSANISSFQGVKY